MKGGGKEIIMKKANDFLRDLKFYPCEDPYTGCNPGKDFHSGDCEAPGKIIKEAQGKTSLFIAGDYSAPSI